VDRGLHIGPIKNPKKIIKKKPFFPRSPYQATITAAGQPGEVVAED
jgi:hypothetical protein